MNKNIELILEAVGGTGNIDAVTHCMTRLRFILIDDSKANLKNIEDIDIVKGTFTSGGQFQIIIGNNVADVYKEFISIAKIDSYSKEEVRNKSMKKQNVFQKFSSFMAEIFAPIIPAIIVGGLILGLRNLMEIPFELFNGVSVIEYSVFFNGVHDFLWLIGEAVFHFLPIYITWSVVKKVGGTEVLGIVLGVTLVSPQLQNAYAVSGANEIPYWDFGFTTIQMIGYQAQVIPAILIGLIAGITEVRLRKIVPNSIQMIVIPFIILVGGALLAHIVIGPIGWSIGSLIASIVMWLFDKLGFIAGIIYGTIYAPLVITGLHHTLLPIDLQLITQNGSTFLWPIVALSNIAQGSAVLGIVLVKKSSKEREVSIPSLISAWLGVTEPAMFGVNLKYSYPFVAGMIGAGIAGGYATLTNIIANSVGIGGIPAILSINSNSALNFLIAMLIAIVVPLILVIVKSKKEKNARNFVKSDISDISEEF